MQLNKLFRQYRELIISIGVILVSILGFVLGVVPLVKKTMVLNTEYRTLSQEVDVLREKASVLQSIDEGTMKTDLQALLFAVPSDKSISSLLGTIDSLTAKTGVTPGTVSLAKLGSLATASAQRLNVEEKTVGSNIVPFTMSISGTLDQTRTFLATSVSVRRVFRIRSFDVSFMKTDTVSTASATMVSTHLSMDAFYSPLPTSIGSVSQPLTPLTGADTDLIEKVVRIPLLVPPSIPLPPPSAGPAKLDPFSL